MSITILEFAKSFVSGRLSADEFVNSYLELWKIERDNRILEKDDNIINECLSTIFCLSDLYNPDFNREPYELDEVTLRREIANILKKIPNW